MPVYEREQQKSIEGFYTNINFPGSKAATPNNTPSKAVYQSRKLLEVDNNLAEQVQYLNQLGEEITNDVNTLQTSSTSFMSEANDLVTEEDKMKLSNLVINKLYTEPELQQNIHTEYVGDAWAFNYIYKNIPNTANGAYRWSGALIKPNLDDQGQAGGASPDQMYINQDKKLTFEECREYAAQNGQKIFGITDAENHGGIMKGYCLIVKPSIGWPFSHGMPTQKNRILHLNQTGGHNISVDIPVGDIAISPVYKLASGGQDVINYTRANSQYGYPGFGFIGTYRDLGDSRGTQRTMTYIGPGTLFEGARMAKQRGFKYFGCQWFGGRWVPTGTRFTDTNMRRGQIFGSNSLEDATRFGTVAPPPLYGSVTTANFFTYGPESESESSHISGPLYTKTYVLGGGASNAIYKIDEDSDSALSITKEGEVDLDTHSSLTGAPEQRQLAEKEIDASTFNSLAESKNGTIIGFGNFVTEVIQKLETRNFPYVGFGIFLNQESNTYTLRAFGANNTTATRETTYHVTDDQNRKYGTANTISVYTVHEKMRNGNLANPRPKRLLGQVNYIDEKKESWAYPADMIGGTGGVAEYSIRNNKLSKYFNANIDGVTSTQLQTATMTIPKCRDICNTYNECAAFAYQSNALGPNGDIVPRCFIKSEDPSIYSFGTESDNSSKIYVKLPKVNNSFTCSKKVSFGPSSLTYKVGDTNSFNNFSRLDSDGAEMDTITPKGNMTASKRCSPWTNLEQNTSAMQQLQSKIGRNIQLYSSVITQLKKYNNDLNGQAITNKPMVDASVKQYKVIIDKISAYAKDGSFRTDKEIAASSDITRKSDIYIYTLWLTVAVIICIFTFMTIMRIKN
jgi:hypothetical protein